MKTYLIVLLIFVFLFCLGGLTVYIEAKKESDLKQREIDGLKRTNKKEKDSLLIKLAIKQDSLNIVLQLMSVAHQESVEAHQRSQATIRNLQRIIFITHTDSSRNAELTKLYPSWKQK